MFELSAALIDYQSNLLSHDDRDVAWYHSENGTSLRLHNDTEYAYLRLQYFTARADTVGTAIMAAPANDPASVALVFQTANQIVDVMDSAMFATRAEIIVAIQC